MAEQVLLVRSVLLLVEQSLIVRTMGRALAELALAARYSIEQVVLAVMATLVVGTVTAVAVVMKT